VVRRLKAVQRHPPVMKTIRGLPNGAFLVAVDNSGAKEIQLISVINYKPVLNRYPAAAIGDMIVGSVTKGNPELRKKVVRAIVIQMCQKFRRADGSFVRFEQNGAVVVDEDGNPKGTEIKGPVAREAVDRWPGLGKSASMVV
jgi:large subunit ribosomal protein L14